jgi:cytochrome bd-type quinol oxidase subunit 1
MQVPVGYVEQNGVAVPDDWVKIIFNEVAMVRFVHMLLAAYLTGAFCVAATGAWYMLRNTYYAEARVMLRMVFSWRPFSFRCSSCSGIWSATMCTTISPSSLRRSRRAGMTSSPPAK